MAHATSMRGEHGLSYHIEASAPGRTHAFMFDYGVEGEASEIFILRPLAAPRIRATDFAPYSSRSLPSLSLTSWIAALQLIGCQLPWPLSPVLFSGVLGRPD
jgi:hypothetical protein